MYFKINLPQISINWAEQAKNNPLIVVDMVLAKFPL